MERAEADKLFFNGMILTMDSANPQVEAVAVKDGKIMDVGSYGEMLCHVSDETEMVDLKGKTMLPGFIDPHCHYEVATMMDSLVHISSRECSSSEEVLQKIKKTVEETEPGKWAVLVGYDQLFFTDLPDLDVKYLDELATDKQILILTFTFHVGYVNSKALEVIGITKDTPNPQGGAFGHYDNGELNGHVIELPAVARFMFPALYERKFNFKEEIVRKANNYAKNGITTSFGPGVFEIVPDTMKAIREVITRKDAPVRSGFTVLFEQLEQGKVKLEDFPKDDPNCWCTGVKFFYDGAPYSATMLVQEPYVYSEEIKRLNLPCTVQGKRTHKFEKYKELIRKYHEMGCQIQVHCQGDLAAKEVLDAFEYAMDCCPRYDLRHRIEHGMLIKPEDIKRAKKLGVCISMHANHIRYYGEILRDSFIGNERADRVFACREAIDAGHRLSLHCDDPMFPGLPLSVMETVVTRKTDRGEAIGTAEKVTVEEGLRMLTIDAAWQIHMEDKIGSIELGKYADFVVLEENPYEVQENHLSDIKVLGTYKDGNKVEKMVL